MTQKAATSLQDLFDDISLGGPQNAVGFVMWRVMHRYQREIDQVLSALDLTHLQFTTLTLVAWMGRNGEPATQSDVARFGDIHPMQISNVMKALEQKSMIRRTPSPRNALAKQVMITASGTKTLRASLPLVMEVQSRLFGEGGRPGGALLEALLRADTDR